MGIEQVWTQSSMSQHWSHVLREQLLVLDRKCPDGVLSVYNTMSWHYFWSSFQYLQTLLGLNCGISRHHNIYNWCTNHEIFILLSTANAFQFIYPSGNQISVINTNKWRRDPHVCQYYAVISHLEVITFESFPRTYENTIMNKMHSFHRTHSVRSCEWQGVTIC